MKKIFLGIFIFSCFQLFAQEEQTGGYLGDNEIKINVGYVLVGLPEISYERILSDDTSIGIAVAFGADSDIDINFVVIPYGRFYFGKKRNSGFFLEGNAGIFSEDYDEAFFNGNTTTFESGTKLGIGAGLGLGGKFLTKNGWIGEVLIGAGRNFVNTDFISEVYPRAGISLGKRF